MAAARQNEINASMTVLATTTFVAVDRVGIDDTSSSLSTLRQYDLMSATPQLPRHAVRLVEPSTPPGSNHHDVPRVQGPFEHRERIPAEIHIGLDLHRHCRSHLANAAAEKSERDGRRFQCQRI